MPNLMGMKNIMVLNDEAHHCYREKIGNYNEGDLRGDDRKEAQKNNEAARLWISGLEIVKHKLGISQVFDLSATPFFLRGSGYAEGTLFPWTMSDFSLMDAIECGIVKLPRVPVADNIPGEDMPKFRNLWKHIGKRMPKKGRGKSKTLDPFALPVELQTALQALYGHYVKTFDLWQKVGIKAPPCFIIVCNNTSTSKLVYDYISGFIRENEDGSSNVINGRLELFRNFDEYDNPIACPRTLLIDSEQLESGDALDKNFRKMAESEIDRFRREIMLHSCGAIEPLLDDLIDAGLEAINPVQISCSGMEPALLKEKYGDRICFWGGSCDTRDILPHQTPGEVARHVRKQVEIMRKGSGFVFQHVHNIMADIQPENIVALFNAVNQ